MLCFSGQGNLTIKTDNHPPVFQKVQGIAVGFKGNKIFTLHNVTMNTVDIPQTTSLYHYVEAKNWNKAYELSCLGVAEEDWRQLAIEALTQHEFDIARKCFIRIKDFKFIDLLDKLTRKSRNETQL